jgi:hypothetical protein
MAPKPAPAHGTPNRWVGVLAALRIAKLTAPADIPSLVTAFDVALIMARSAVLTPAEWKDVINELKVSSRGKGSSCGLVCCGLFDHVLAASAAIIRHHS